MTQAVAAADELASNLDGERRAVLAYWEAVHQRGMTPWQEASGAVAAYPWRADSLGLASYIGEPFPLPGDPPSPAHTTPPHLPPFPWRTVAPCDRVAPVPEFY